MSWNILPKNVLQYFLTKLKGLMYTKTEVDNLIPVSLSDLSDDSTHRLVTDTEKTAWDGKSVVSANPQSTTGTLSGLEIDGVGYAVQGGGGVTGVKGNSESTYRTGNVNLTPANIGAVSKSGDTVNGCLIVQNTGNNFDEGVRINKNSSDLSGYVSFVLGSAKDSATGIQDGAWWIGLPPIANGRKLFITHNGSTQGETYFEADSASRKSPALRLGWSGNVADGNAYAVTGDVVYDYITSHMLNARPDASGNMNDAAGFGNSMGMIYLSGTDETVNPNGQTGWHHFINMSYRETSGSNMWQTQLACMAGTSDIFIRSRSGGSITAGTAWAAPWIRLVKGIQRVAKSCNWMPGRNGVYFEEYTAGSNYDLPSNAWYHIITMQGADTKYGTQLALGMTTEAVYYRKYDNKTWGSWKSLINTNTTYSANNGVGLSGTTFYNSGVRDISINGNYLRKNVNGTNTDLTIPYAASAGSASAVTQTNSNNNGNFRVLLSGTADDTTRTEGIKKSVKLLFNPFSAAFHVYSNDKTKVTIESTGSITFPGTTGTNGANIFSSTRQHMYLRASDEPDYGIYIGIQDNVWAVMPPRKDYMRLGTPNYRWNQIYSSNAAISTSDRKEKKDIVPLDDSARDFIMTLNPVSYKMINGDSGRTHYGMIAQDVEEELKELGMTAIDFAGLCKDKKMKDIQICVSNNGERKPEYIHKQAPIQGEYIYGLRYEEFIAPLIKTVQLQQQEIEELKHRIDILEEKINGRKIRSN